MESPLSIPESGIMLRGMEDRKRFGKRIATARKARGINAVDLAPLLGIAASRLSAFEKGNFTHVPPPDVMQAIERELGVRQADLLTDLGYLGDTKKRPDELAALYQLLDADMRDIVQDDDISGRLVKSVKDLGDWARDRQAIRSAPVAEAASQDRTTPAAAVRTIRRTK